MSYVTVGNFILIKCQNENPIHISHTNYADHVQKESNSCWNMVFSFRDTVPAGILISVLLIFSIKNVISLISDIMWSTINMIYDNHTENHPTVSTQWHICTNTWSQLHVK